MLLFLPALALGSSSVLEVEQGRLTRVGERLGEATVARIEQHPEFDRMHLLLDDGEELTVELSLFRSGSPACQHHGFALFPRLDLSPDLAPAKAAAPVATLCGRLETSGAELDLRDIRSADAKDNESPSTRAGGSEEHRIHIPSAQTGVFRPLHGLLLGILLLLPLARLRQAPAPLRDGLGVLAPLRDGFGVLALALLARLLLSPRGLLIAPDAGFENIVLSWGLNAPHPLYSDAFTALHAPLQRLSGYDPELVFGLHLLLSALSAPLLWLVASHSLRDRWGALFAGLSLALLPVALRLAGSELAHVPLSFFELLAVLAALNGRASMPSALLAALATAFAVHLRPEALPFAALPAAILLLSAREHRRLLLPLALLVGLALHRAQSLPPFEDQGPIKASALLAPEFWVQAFRPRIGPPLQSAATYQVFLDMGVTPFLLPLLALGGLVHGWRTNRGALLLALSWAALCIGPVLPKAWPILDAWRLQLAGQAALLLLAALGLGLLPRLRPWLLLAPLVTLPLYLSSIRERWAGMEEWRALNELLPTLPAGSRVLFADHEVHASAFAQVGALLQHRAGAEPWWLPMEPFIEAPDPGADLFAWEGLTCRIDRLPGRRVDNDATVNACLRLRERCTLTPWQTRAVPSRSDADIRIPEGTEVGLYRVDGCR